MYYIVIYEKTLCMIIFSLVFLGYKKGLEEGDVWELHDRDKSVKCGPLLENAWKKEVDACKK